MRRSDTVSFASREAPAETHAAARTLRQAGLITRFGSGRYAMTPTGERVRQKITARVRAAMTDIGGQEVSLPALQGRSLWEESGRWESFEGEMFTFTDRENRDLCLAPTHEEGVVELLRGVLRSYDELPVLLFQIGRKYRDDHARNGLLRTKEFTMKDAYSLHADEASLERCYANVRAAYIEALEDVGLDVVIAAADNSVMGGSASEEFIAPVEDGTLELYSCDNQSCRFGVTDEHAEWDTYQTGMACPTCDARLSYSEGVEVGHIFQLGTRYSEAMDLTIDHADGKKPVQMASYGIGITRVLQTIVQQHGDDDGCCFPITKAGTVAPYQVGILPLRYEGEVATVADELHESLGSEETLLFDDPDTTIGERFAIADRMGIPLKVVIGNHFHETGDVEIQTRHGETMSVTRDAVTEVIAERLAGLGPRRRV